MVKSIYRKFCRIELWVAAALLMAIATLVFVSAIARTLRHPLNWTVDFSMFLFAWLVFLGGDIVVRETELISVNIFQNWLSPPRRKVLQAVFLVLMIAFLAVLVRYGVPLLLDNWKRQFQTMELSYSWCTLAVPVGSVLMIISCGIRLYKLLCPRPGSGKGQ
ncbi:MAG: TRAP transporter small permease [Planctomycetota bacterium]|nr:TRAP transporter small permease [Planctomycetota bacterium]